MADRFVGDFVGGVLVHDITESDEQGRTQGKQRSDVRFGHHASYMAPMSQGGRNR